MDELELDDEVEGAEVELDHEAEDVGEGADQMVASCRGIMEADAVAARSSGTMARRFITGGFEANRRGEGRMRGC